MPLSDLFSYLTGKYHSLWGQLEAKKTWQPIEIARAEIVSIQKALGDLLKTKSDSALSLSSAETRLIERLRKTTARANRNNVTRTEAYREMYFQHPELHWAFLAHMVSRNGGWNMTDLKGELLPRLMDEQKTGHFFRFLERANALIFHDAYPQLLLYSESLRQKRNLFHLLPAFHVSLFMKPFWNRFWQHRNSAPLTIALIINEQNYIEKRVVRHPFYREHVIRTVEFQTQSLLQLNQVIFPYKKGDQISLAGLVMEDFSDLDERIEVGRRLYATLFGYPQIREGALQFAGHTIHTGSRSDFWPHLFSRVKRDRPSGIYTEKLDGCKLKQNASPFYSPELEQAWRDVPFEPAEPGDWLADLSPLRYLRTLKAPFPYEMTNEYCFALNKVELAAAAASQVK